MDTSVYQSDVKHHNNDVIHPKRKGGRYVMKQPAVQENMIDSFFEEYLCKTDFAQDVFGVEF
jgi:hypothetical protein